LRHAPHLVYTDLSEPFMAYVRVALCGGTFITLPFVVEITRRYFRDVIRIPFWVTLSVSLIVIASVALTDMLVVPYAVGFFMSFGKDFAPMVTLDRYLGFYIAMLVMSFSTLILPIIVYVVVIAVRVPRLVLRRLRPYALIISFVVAAIVTPPDLISQCIVAAIFYLAYEALSLVAIK